MCVELISRLVKKNVQQRMGFDELVQHEFIAGFRMEYLEIQTNQQKLTISKQEARLVNLEKELRRV
jgi:hypothetical protein